MTCILIIAGTDSSGGAGLTRDTATATSLDCAVKPVVTAVTAQTNGSVVACETMPPKLVAQQIAAAFEDTQPLAVKIGLLGNAELACAVADALAQHDLPIVLDPVLVSSSGRHLMSDPFPPDLLQQTTVITPNLAEAATITQSAEADCTQSMKAQADALMDMGTKAVLIKGGHGTGDQASDYLFEGQRIRGFHAPRLKIEKRGTGCTLSTAIACYMAQGHALENACNLAKQYLQVWMA